MDCCCWKYLLGGSKSEDLTKDLISNEEKPEPITEEKIKRMIIEDEDVASEVSTEIDYENDIFEKVDSDDEQEQSQNSSNASTVVRFIDSLTLNF
jgi:hypothetical protein